MIKRLSANKMNDDSIMPFGKYKGRKMSHVPAEYLHWVWHNIKIGNDNMMLVRDYIYDNMNVLEEENEDLIWDKKQ